jgi:hypothetical protein
VLAVLDRSCSQCIAKQARGQRTFPDSSPEIGGGLNPVGKTEKHELFIYCPNQAPHGSTRYCRRPLWRSTSF